MGTNAISHRVAHSLVLKTTPARLTSTSCSLAEQRDKQVDGSPSYSPGVLVSTSAVTVVMQDWHAFRALLRP